MAESTQLLSTWCQHFENVPSDVSRFYASVEAALATRKVPEVKTSRVNMKEGGLLSASREYLRITRDDLRYDVCGAPFGNGFFVSSRLFAEGRFADSLVGDMAKGGAFSELAGALTAKVIGTTTYYKLDTAQMFLQLVHKSMLDAVDQLTSQASQPALIGEDRRPVLQSFFR